MAGSPYDELIAALMALKESIRGPQEQMLLAAEAEELQEAMEARGQLQNIIGMVPLPGDHPDFAVVTGAIGEAMGKVDNVNQAYQNVRSEAADARAAIENISYVIDSVIIGFQQGSGG
jgi:hypothetical protein